ncbi:MAG: PRC-barrel domain-containing protein [Chloroflexota bacterium]|nr:PRC-barrel domain-containing protein [Chloroflexota bacterium]
MLRSTKEYTGLGLLTEDGEIGKVRDLYFKYEDWSTIRYLAINTGPWIFGRRVLIPTAKFGSPDLISRLIPVSLTKEQIKSSENYDKEKPVSHRQGSMINEMIGYHVYAKDGEIGRVEDFIFEEDETWLVRSLVLKMGKGLFSKKVVIASHFVELINFRKSTVYLSLARVTIRNSPEYDREEHINKELSTPPQTHKVVRR